MSQQSLALFNNAELALAAYATLAQGATAAKIVNLVAEGMSFKQANEFSTRYPTIITQFNDTVPELGMGTSFSATVFKDTAGNAAGNVTIAIRGTLEIFSAPPNDIIPTDLDIFNYGAGYDQIVAMVNWWARVSAPAGQLVNQFRLLNVLPGSVPPGAVVLRPSSEFANAGKVLVLDSAPQVAATGGPVRDALLADPDQRAEITGHSLGGHLAMAFSTLFAAQTGQVTLFNAPGFGDTVINQAFFAKL